MPNIDCVLAKRGLRGQCCVSSLVQLTAELLLRKFRTAAQTSLFLFSHLNILLCKPSTAILQNSSNGTRWQYEMVEVGKLAYMRDEGDHAERDGLQAAIFQIYPASFKDSNG
jgi:hypothetical protein